MKTVSIVLTGVLVVWLGSIVAADEKTVALKDEPQAVLDTVEARVPGAVLKEARVETDEGQRDHFTVEIALALANGNTTERTFTPAGAIGEDEKDDDWTRDFEFEKPELVSSGKNPYFVLEPGYVLVLEDGDERLTITVLDETRMVDGVETRVVEERETEGGVPVEVSRNYFAISKRTNSVYYFGESVDEYKGGKVVSHGGSWLSGQNGAKFGLMMPGLPLLGGKYYQEHAPGQAMDRAEVTGLGVKFKTPAGEFSCLKTDETTPLEPGVKETKLYAPGIGLVKDGSLKLVRHGKGAGR
jgi:hypothetical protein